jgi:hypothetical protein
MNRWLYRAAGTVGLAGGVLVLGAGSAQADQIDSLGSPLGSPLADLLSPTSGLPPLDLAAPDRAPLDASGLTLDPADGRGTPATGMPELLPGLPGLPVGGIDALLGGLPVGHLPVNSLPLASEPAGDLPAVGTPLAAGLLDGGLLDGAVLDGLPLPGADPLAGLPLPGADPLAGLPLPAADQLAGLPLPAADQLAGLPLPAADQLAGLPLPAADPAGPGGVSGVRTLPADLTVPGLPVPDGQEAVAPLIAEWLAWEGGFSPDLFAPAAPPGPAEVTGALPLLGPALEPAGATAVLPVDRV